MDVSFDIDPDAYERDPSVGSQLCTPTKVLGSRLPNDVDVAVRDINWSTVQFTDFLGALGQPSLWLTLGVGGSALLIFGAFARLTGTQRAALAASVSIVFLGLLLFPAAFTGTVPSDLRIELIEAWKWVIVFYFGSEAAVQAFKLRSPGADGSTGDVPLTQVKEELE